MLLCVTKSDSINEFLYLDVGYTLLHVYITILGLVVFVSKMSREERNLTPQEFCQRHTESRKILVLVLKAMLVLLLQRLVQLLPARLTLSR